MGVFIFFMLAAIEIALAVISIITKSNQLKVRSITRIFEGAALLLLIILSIIHWDPSYYALTGLLLLLAVTGVMNLIRKRNEKRPYTARHTILKAIGMSLLIFIAALPAILFPQYKEIKPTGSYKVATIIYTYTDTNRIETYTNTGENRKLNVEFWYPKDAQGTYPLVVFSHGSFGIKESNETLYNELASHGYVVCSIDHTYQCFSTTDVNGNTIRMNSTYAKEIQAEDAHNNKQQSYEYYQKWMKIRTGDINFVIDYILGEAKTPNSDRVYKLVDSTKIGIMGHSLGGSASLGIGRMRSDIKAVISLEAPFMCDIEGVKNNEFVFTKETYPVPVLNVYSDSSWGHLADWPQYAENYALLSNMNETAFNVHISGVGHLSLTDLSLTSPMLTRLLNGHKSTKSAEDCLKTINKIGLEFFDCYLKGEGQFKSSGDY